MNRTDISKRLSEAHGKVNQLFIDIDAQTTRIGTWEAEFDDLNWAKTFLARACSELSQAQKIASKWEGPAALQLPGPTNPASPADEDEFGYTDDEDDDP